MFAIVFFWTPPHFWALSLRYFDDYKAAGIPMLPVVKGVAARAAAQILVYSFVVVAITLVLPLVADVGVIYIGVGGRARARVHRAARSQLARHTPPSARSSFFTLSNIYLALALRRHCRRHHRPLRLTPRAPPSRRARWSAHRGRRGARSSAW